jgi:hypothetical protein
MAASCVANGATSASSCASPGRLKSVLHESLSFGPMTSTALPVDSTTPLSRPMLASPPVKVPAAVAAPVKVALVIVTPGPTSVAASVAALFVAVTDPILATIFSPRGAGGVRGCETASLHGSHATANAMIRRLVCGIAIPRFSDVAHCPPSAPAMTTASTGRRVKE